MPSSSLLVTNTASESVSISSEASTSLPLSKPATVALARPDPIEEFAQKLKGSGSKEDYQLSRKLEAKMRTFAPVIVRGEETQGVRFWGFGKTVYQELLALN